MEKQAVIESGGKQYRVSPGTKIKVERLKGISEGEIIKFDKILLLWEGEKVKLGMPYLQDVVVEGKILAHKRDDKKIVFRYKPKTRYRKKKGHRQPYTEVEIIAIHS